MFELKKSSGSTQRRGVLHTVHGDIETPCFMPIATYGAVKTLTPDDLKRVGVSLILSNTYHLLCRPGMDAMRAEGGLHSWMHWDQPILTDSGGYQVFSLAKMNRVTENGVTFQSHIDGARIDLSPEQSIAMQQAIGSDIMMPLDVLLSSSATVEDARAAMQQSVRWAQRSKDYLESYREDSLTRDQQLFGIVQGGVYEDVREESVCALVDIGFDGYAIGGLSVGESREDNLRVARFVAERLPSDTPRYFMGGGSPEEIVAYVRMGIDLFDCVIPTRHARHGSLFAFCSDTLSEDGSFYEVLHINNAVYANDKKPVDATCDCTLCTQFSRSYLKHLFDMKEMLGMRLATEHNVRFYMRLMERLRAK